MDQQILDGFRGKDVLVTGGTGLIGRQVVKLLLEAGAKVTIVSLDNLKPYPDANYVQGDLTNLELCLHITSGRDFVFHLAGVKAGIETSKAKVASHFVPTLMMTTNLLEACRRNSVGKTLFTSSIGAYPNLDIFVETEKYDKPPMDFAGWAKRMGELQIQAYKIEHGLTNFSTVRLSNVYGPGDNFDPNNAMVIPSLLSRIRSGESPLKVWGDGTAKRDFLYSYDAAIGILLAIFKGTNSEFINLGSGEAISIKTLIETLSSIIGFDYEFDTSKPSGAPLKLMNIELARKSLGFNPSFSLHEGLEHTWKWYVENEFEYNSRHNYFA
jgi:GDP-L-fucose synthase